MASFMRTDMSSRFILERSTSQQFLRLCPFPSLLDPTRTIIDSAFGNNRVRFNSVIDNLSDIVVYCDSKIQVLTSGEYNWLETLLVPLDLIRGRYPDLPLCVMDFERTLDNLYDKSFGPTLPPSNNDELPNQPITNAKSSSLILDETSITLPQPITSLKNLTIDSPSTQNLPIDSPSLTNLSIDSPSMVNKGSVTKKSKNRRNRKRGKASVLRHREKKRMKYETCVQTTAPVLKNSSTTKQNDTNEIFITEFEFEIHDLNVALYSGDTEQTEEEVEQLLKYF